MIRKFRAADAQAVSDLIRVTMWQSNTSDYPPERLRPLMDYFNPAKVGDLNLDRCCLVAEQEDRIVGTVAVEGAKLCTFFVHPDDQKKGLGTRLLGAIERVAQEVGLDRLIVESSLTGASFYERNGYRSTGKMLEGVAGPQIEMEKRWKPGSGGAYPEKQS